MNPQMVAVVDVLLEFGWGMEYFTVFFNSLGQADANFNAAPYFEYAKLHMNGLSDLSL